MSDNNVIKGSGDAATDTTDSRGAQGQSLAPAPPKVFESIFLSDEYKMTYQKRGLAVIINNKTFDKSTGMGERTGTNVDAANIFHRLKLLGFDVETKPNMKREQMRDFMVSISKMDHSNHDCFACVILSHGEEGMVFGTNGPIEIKELVEPFKGHRCESLAGKPKLFFIQACRGQGLDHGQVVTDAGGGGEPMEEEMEPITYRIPTEADFLMAYSVVPGFFSWRNSSNGSWFIQALCIVLKEFGTSMDLMTMMTRVNKIVAYNFESNASKEFMNRKKQIPCITSMLTKEVYFRPKN